MKIIVAGSRTFTTYQYVAHRLGCLEVTIDEVISGGAPGVDRIGESWAKEHHISVKRFPANWDKYGKDMDDSYITEKTLLFELIPEKEQSWHYAPSWD